eukprot:106736_1
MGVDVEKYSVTVATCYFVLYLTIFAITSVVCALQTKKVAASCCSKTFFKLWIKSLWQKKKLYLTVIPHFFDQATDLGVLFKYYSLWVTSSAIEPQYWFFVSIFVISLHKIISCIAVYLLSRSCMDVIYQFFDLLMVRAIYTNYKLNKDEPSSAQRYLQILEGTFEPGPQILISLAYILKTRSARENVDDGIVFISIVASLWTLTSRIVSDDKSVMADEWQSLEFSYKRCPILNWRYLFRVFWRFCEITNKATLYALIWLSIGGFSLIFIIGFEFLCCICLSIMAENMLILGNLLYWTIIDSAYLEHKYLNMGKCIQYIAISYRFGSLYIYLILVTLFAIIRFNAWKVPDFHTRHQHVMEQDSLGLLLYMYCWTTAIVWPLCLVLIRNIGVHIKYAGRDIARLISSQQWQVALELVEFAGVDSFPDDGKTIHALQDLYRKIYYGNTKNRDDLKHLDPVDSLQHLNLDPPKSLNDGAVLISKLNDASIKTLETIFERFDEEMKIVEARLGKKGVEHWLTDIGLQQYHESFTKSAFVSMKYILTINTSEPLKTIGVVDSTHQETILADIKRLKQDRDEMKNWLGEIGCRKYYPLFISAHVVSLNIISQEMELTNDDCFETMLRHIGVILPSDIDIILEEVQKLRSPLQTF